MRPETTLDPYIVYSNESWADIGPHVFPMEKYRGVFERLVAEDGLGQPIDPPMPSREELSRVHTEAYLDDLESGRHTVRTATSELPMSHEIARFFTLACGGTTIAARQSHQLGWCAHLGGGFHHAFADRAEGFCYLNDLAVAARALQADGTADRVAIVDVDVHQGNGTAAIFAGDETVFTFSIHQQDNYPIKERSDRDIGLLSFDPRRTEPFVTDDLYLGLLEPAIVEIFDAFDPQLVLYQGGADPYREDQLGGFRLTHEGLARRDEVVFREARDRSIPLALTFGGGYARDVRDTIAIHLETVRVARRVWSEAS